MPDLIRHPFFPGQVLDAGFLGTPEEFAALVASLASDRSGYITGAAIQIDGGWYKGVM